MSPQFAPVPAVVAGNVYTPTMYNNYVAANMNKLLNQQHRKLTLAQFNTLTGVEDTDECYLEVDATANTEWHLVYRLSVAKWRKIGGPPLVSMVDASESTASAVFVDLTTVGPSLQCPRGGDYDAVFGAYLTASATGGAVLSPKLAAAAPVDGDGVTVTTNQAASCSRSRRFTGRATSDVIKLVARSGAGTASFASRFLNLDAVWVA